MALMALFVLWKDNTTPGTMALMALFVLWKDNTTPGKLLVKEINFVRQTAPAGQFPVSECWFSSSDSSGRSEIQDICHYRAADA
ncbi:conjugal transfer protein TraP, partial [Escherichia coli]|uniref:conjugal transfer protein TraP n=1 Tax=Escherichia coli TaxID=562 RepID=UPI0024DF11FF